MTFSQSYRPEASTNMQTKYASLKIERTTAIKERTKAIKQRATAILLSRRGSVMVESSIFFPIIFLATMFTIYMMINMYSETVFQAKANREVRAASMAKVENASVEIGNPYANDRYRNAAESVKVNLSEGNENGFDNIYGSGSLIMESGKLTGYKTRKNTYYARAYCIDEKKYIIGIF